MVKKYDFSGWATKNDILCSDGRIIRKDAFKHNDGQKVPLVWNHSHNNPLDVLGHAILENRDEGVYTYCTFNDTKQGLNAKKLVQHGDVEALSIYANKLKQQGPDVIHGDIKEVSLVLAGANMGACIKEVMAHGEIVEDEGVIYSGEYLTLEHSEDHEIEVKSEDDETEADETEDEAENESEEVVEHADSEDDDKKEDQGDESIADVLDTLTDKQKTVVYGVIGQALLSKDPDQNEDSEGGNKEMKHNVFDHDNEHNQNVLTHADGEEIIKIARDNRYSLRQTLKEYAEDRGCDASSLAHGFVDSEGQDAIETLFPEYKDVRPGAPEFIERDQGWVTTVMQKTHKSPISRIRTRQADITGTDLRAYGYQKGSKKKLSGNIKLLKRTTDPQTVYRKDALHRDDIIDITDFDVVAYQYYVMKQNLNEEIATAIMIGDGRDDGAEDKIEESHIRSIWNDDELYAIHTDVDIAAAKTALQGSNTSANFGENYIYAEAIITAALYAREKYKGSGNLDFFCTPHLLNIMLLARDLNGRRIYNSKADIAAALNVSNIHTAEQFEGKVRTTDDGDKKKLLGIFVNLNDYQVGSTRGGEITKFSQFDIDYNQEKYLIETRLSGALTRVKSAIILEEPVESAGA